MCLKIYLEILYVSGAMSYNHLPGNPLIPHVFQQFKSAYSFEPS